MKELEVGKKYTIQPIKLDLGDFVMDQDTIIEIIKIESGEVTYWSSQDGKIHSHSIMAIRMGV